MTWTKLSDDFTDDIWTLSDAAFRLHTEGLIWSNRKLLDLRIPAEDLRRFAKHPEAVAELIAKTVWSVDGDTYVIEHHATYQRNREDVIKQQAANKANQAKRGLKTPAGRERFSSPPNDSNNDSLNERDNEMDGTGRAITTTSGEVLHESEDVGRPSKEPGAEERTTGGNGQVPMRLGATPEGPPDAHATAAKALNPGTIPRIEPSETGSLPPHEPEVNPATGEVADEPAPVRSWPTIIPGSGGQTAVSVPATTIPRCVVPGCGNQLYSDEALKTGVCRRKDTAHEIALQRAQEEGLTNA